MNLKIILIRLLTILQIVTFSQNSHVQRARLRIHDGLKDDSMRSSSDSWPLPIPHNHQQHQQHHHQYHNHHRLRHNHQYHHHYRPHQHRLPRHQRRNDDHHITYRWLNHHNRWSGRRGSFDKHHFTAWTMWTGCGTNCVRRRERYCKVIRKCGHTKQLEEQECWNCQPSNFAASDNFALPHRHQEVYGSSPFSGNDDPRVTRTRKSHAQLPVFEEIQRGSISQQAISDYARTIGGQMDDFYILNTKKPNYKKKRKPIFVDVDDYADLEVEEVENGFHKLNSETPAKKRIENHPVHSLNTRRKSRQRPTERNLLAGNDGIDGDVFQYEDFDFETDLGGGVGNQYSDSYDDIDYGDDFRNSSFVKERATPDALIPRHRRIYSKWSRWTKCSPKCTTRRYKKCRIKEHCGREVLREIAYCYTEGSFCQQWLQAQVQKSSPFDLRPVSTTRRREISTSEDPQSNAIVSDFIMNGKGYRGPEYTPLKLKCGIASIHKRNLYNMLKIIGGKASRKGEWPWQVAIFNRFKEAFCGGTLIAPQWVLTAAHCVRKVLYVRLGEHNLDHHDGTELQLRVLKSYKHPNFDKKTVDSDVALLRLPQSTNATTWIGFSCLPRPYQPLPRNVDCTVIGWGKRRNRDVAGTSVLHQAEVPIIPMENCRSVYHDYTITKNMFCAGHKRGRIDTCAGDSGGPLLCRDTTKPNHPWTIFGITSFGDGCAKRNKFGIYAKVPNYVDWAWSVINCNGNCKLHQRS